MNYLTNYYKNLCEDLQHQIDLLEAGLKNAIRTKNPELIKKEKAKAEARRERELEAGTEAGGKMIEAQRKHGASSSQAGTHALSWHTHHATARKMDKNIHSLDKVGHEDADVNNDGVVDETDDYLLHRREVIGDAINRHEHKKGYKGTKRNPERKPTDDELARMHELEMDRAMHRDYEN